MPRKKKSTARLIATGRKGDARRRLVNDAADGLNEDAGAFLLGIGIFIGIALVAVGIGWVISLF